MVKDPHSPGHQGAKREDKARARPAAAAIAAIAAIVLSFLAAACFRPSAGADDWPLSVTLVRDPVVDSEGLVWAGAGTGRGVALESVGAVRYRFDLLIPEVRETRHCLFYERQLDRRERRHLLYAE